MVNRHEQPEIFTDRWGWAELPKIPDSGIKLNPIKISAMGSCFARNFNRWLIHHRYTDREQPWDILYNPFSIHKELERLYSPVPLESHVLKEISVSGEGRFRDPWRTWLVAKTKEELQSLNSKFDQKAKSHLQNTSAFIITLGLSEVWCPAANPEIVLNQVPTGSIRINKGAWVERFATTIEVQHALIQSVNVVRTHISDKCPIIFTLSPIPLKFTASQLSIREANNLSKATLLVALRQLLQERSDVGYFPSYEIAQALTERSGGNAWQADKRHVTAEVVDTICQTFALVYGLEKPRDVRNRFWVPKVDGEGKIIGKLYT